MYIRTFDHRRQNDHNSGPPVQHSPNMAKIGKNKLYENKKKLE